MKEPIQNLENNFKLTLGNPRKIFIITFTVVSLIFISTSFLFVFASKQLTKAFIDRTPQDIANIKLLQKIRSDINQVRIDLAQFTSVNSEKKETILNRREQFLYEIHINLEKFKKSDLNESERILLGGFEDKWKEYTRQAPTFFKLAQNGKTDKANIFRSLYTNPPAQASSDIIDKVIEIRLESYLTSMLGSIDISQRNEVNAFFIQLVSALITIFMLINLMRIFKSYELKISRYTELLLKKNEELLQEQTKSLQNAKLASLGQISAGIAHEINNPLATISGAIQLLPSSINDTEKFNRKVDIIKKSIKRVDKIIKGLRKFSRSTTENTRIEVKLHTVVEEALTLTEAKAKHAEVKIETELDKNLISSCDEIEIEQVLVNLISNAIDAIKNLETKWIKIVLKQENDMCLLHVIDSGRGISPEIEKKLFEPFFTTKPVGEGTGLGLSISKGIIEDHGGQLQINSKFENTCFEIRINKKNVA